MKTSNLVILCLAILVWTYLFSSALITERRITEAVKIQNFDNCMMSNWYSYEDCYKNIYEK